MLSVYVKISGLWKRRGRPDLNPVEPMAGWGFNYGANWGV